jgi:hypothetical protein
VSAANDRDSLLGWIWICLSYGGGTGIMEWKIDCRAYKAFVATLVLAAAVFVQFTEKSPAAENALGTYLLGSKGPQAGMLPPPGIFVTNTLYIYRGDVGVDVEIPTGGKVTVGPDVTAVVDVPSVLWVPDVPILGGHLGIFGLVPIGNVDANVAAELTGPGGMPVAGSDTEQSRTSVGDPQAGAVLGWNSGPFHWNTGFLLNIPLGDYNNGALDNLAFNHWSYDLNASATWLDPAIGFELSATAGITFNEENSATNYKTGDEFHLEFAALQHFSKTFSAGLVGYHYQQVSGDSGSGAVLGGFKGRVTALGPHIALTVPIDGIPVSVSGRFFVEFATEHRLKGTAGFINVSIPLYVANPPPGAP